MPDTDTQKPKATTVKPPPSASAQNAKKKDSPKDGDKTKPKTQRPSGRPIALENQLTEMFTFVGMMVGGFNQTDGEIITANAPTLGKAWANLAKEDKRVKAAIERLMTGSAWGQVIFATGGMAFAIAKNHGIIGELPEPAPGPVPMDVPPGAEHTRPARAATPPPMPPR